ncbi:diguanylate cyclase [Frankia sp. AgB32]|uniref:diguanylate cyclase domain-containing protein n=1 Tax=Frankia sp. AgB32 TaxID=631119 RepID=UPI00200D9AD3|nr:diguanylate cyclase [Frankia sp. AgB32]MCK9897637.1 diguanylate cyclase [Frankia sp. AgB32]
MFIALAILCGLALALDAVLLRSEEAARVSAQAQLVERLARWQSAAGGEAALRAALHHLDLRPGNPDNDQQLARLRLSPTLDLDHGLALLDPDGKILATSPAGLALTAGQLGSAWSSAQAGNVSAHLVRPAGEPPVRATLLPLGTSRPWAVLVALSTENTSRQLAAGLADLRGASTGSVSTITPDGVVLSSTDATRVGSHPLTPDELRRSREQAGGTRSWKSTEHGAEIVHITALDSGTGSLTYLEQRDVALQADLRAWHNRRDLALLAVSAAAVLATLLISLARAASVRRSHAGLRRLLAVAHDIVFVADGSGHLVFVSPAIEPLLGHAPKAWRGRLVSELAHPDDAPRLLGLIGDLTRSPLLDVRLIRADGDADWFDVAARPLPRPNRPTGVIITCHAVGEREGLLDRLGYHAGHDALTGLLNRGAFEEALAAAIVVDASTADASTADASTADASTADASTDAGTPTDGSRADDPPVTGQAVAAGAPATGTPGSGDGGTARPAPRDATAEAGIAVLFIDLDRFKPVNDAFGHAAGDRVLQVVGERIRAELGPGDLAGRFGGDEFGVLLRHADERAARWAARRIIHAVSRPIVVDTRPVQVEASVGIIVTTAGPIAGGPLLRTADKAMYAAKQHGPGRYAVASPAALAAETAGRAATGPAAAQFVVGPPEATQSPHQPDHGGVPPAGTAATDPAARRPGQRSPASRDGAVRDRTARDADGRAALLPRAPDPPPGSPNTAVGPTRDGGRGLGAASVRRLRGQRGRGRPRPEHMVVRSRLLRAVPFLIIGALIPTVTVLSIGIEKGSPRQSESSSTGGAAIANQLADNAARWSQSADLLEPLAELPWSLTDRAADGRLLASRLSPDLTEANSLVTLVDIDGRPLVSRPPGQTAPIPPNSPVWTWAREGGLKIVTGDSSDTLRLLAVTPIRRVGRPIAFLLLRQTLTDAPLNELARAVKTALGVGSATIRPSLGFGLTIVDGDGRAAMSTDPAMIGKSLVDRDELAAVRQRGSQQVQIPGGIVATVVALRTTPAYLVLQRDRRLAAPGPVNHPLSDLLLAATVLVAAAGVLWIVLPADQMIRHEWIWLHVLLHECHDIIICLDTDGCPTFITSAIETLLHHQAAARIGEPLLELIHPEDQDRLRLFLVERRRLGGRGSLLEVRMRAVDGRYLWFDIEAGCSQIPRRRRYHGRDVLLLTCHEVGQRRQLQETLWRRAARDPLTGLPNRLALGDRLDRLAAARTPFTILLIDLDDFKPVNDTYGHQAGDDVLRAIGTRLAAAVPDYPPRPQAEPAISPTTAAPTTAAPTADLAGGVFRLGGDEFVVVLPDIDADDLREASRRIRAAIAAPVVVAGRSIVVRATVGMASSRSVAGRRDGEELSPDAVFRHADSAMYEAKRATRAARTMSRAAP